MVKLDLTCMRGDTASWTIVILDANGLPVDLTTAKIWMTADRGNGGPQIFQRTSLAAAGIVIDADQVVNKGKAVITLDTTSTSILPSETVVLVYDIQYKIGTSVLTFQYGSLTVTPDVTLEVS